MRAPSSDVVDRRVGRSGSQVRRVRRNALLVALLIAGAVAVSVIMSLAIGARGIPFAEVAAALFGRGSEDVTAIVGELRVNRTVLGLTCGSALGAAGALMQAVTRNPIADPGILGVNAGAALGVVIGISLTGGLGLASTVWFALTGALAASAVVLAMSASAMAASSPVRLTLGGVALAAVLSGTSQAFVVLNERVLDSFRFWQLGSLTARPVGEVLPVVPLIAVGCVLALVLLRGLDAIALGDDSAVALGVSPGRVRLLSLLAVALLAGTATALAGPIGFVGLVVPHLIRTLVGPSLRLVLPLSMLAAPALLLSADVVGRVITGGAETPVGVVTAFIGAPLLVAFLVGGRRMALS